MAQRPTRLKRGDTSPAFTATLRDRNGDPIDLTGATLRFLMRTAETFGAGTVIDSAAAIVGAPTDGAMSYTWTAPDTLTPGKFWAEVEVTFGSGEVETFPNVGFHEVIIEQDIG